MRRHTASGAKQRVSVGASKSECCVGLLTSLLFVVRPRSLSSRVMEDSTSATDRRSESTVSLERADLEALIGEVVCREMAGQQAGPSENPSVGGERLGVVVSAVVLPLLDLVRVGASGLLSLPS